VVKIVLYDDYKVGLLREETVVDVSGVVPRGATPQLTIENLITNFHALQGALAQALQQGEGIPLSRVRLRAPVPRPGNIVCMGGISEKSSGARAPADAPGRWRRQRLS
jgi:hypothetical protein